MPTLHTKLAATLSMAALLAAGCGGGRGEAAGGSSEARMGSGDVQVDVINIAFSPATLEIDTGTTVVWTNKDESVRHTATSGLPGHVGVPGVSAAAPPHPDGVFDGDLPDVGDKFAFTFEESGSYAYFCRVHPSMTGEVIVK